MGHKRYKILACIPAYEEEKSIGYVVRGALKYVDMVIVCDDGSKDATAEVAQRAGAVVLRHEQNLGYGAALRTLFNAAKRLNPDIMVVLDADGQHDPGYIPSLVKPIISGKVDIVVGSRFLSKTEIPTYRRLGIKIITWLIRLVAYPHLQDAQSGFRAYNRRAVRLINIVEPGMGASTEILLKAAVYGLRIGEVPVRIRYTAAAHTLSPWKHGMAVLLITLKHVLIYLFRKSLTKLVRLLRRKSSDEACVNR